MRTSLLPFLLLVSSLIQPCTAQSSLPDPDTDWPWWRGPNRNGVASAEQNPPISWSADNNILWRAAINGRGHGSPTILGDCVYVASADHQRELQLVHCLDRRTGNQLWETVVHQGGFAVKGKRKPNLKASFASSTVATDGERLYINFFNDNAVFATSLSLAGEILWQKKISDYVVYQGYGASPAIYRDLVVVSADNIGGGVIVGLDGLTGEVVWRRSRPKLPNYASPVIIHANGKDQLILIGCNLVTSLDPLTGEELWEIGGATKECVTSTTTDGIHVFTSGGYPSDHISAVKADGSGEVVWRINTRAYVPSLLQRNGFLFATLDAGIAVCFRCDTGEEVWKGRLGGTFSSSPVLVGKRIYATSEEGITHVFEANAEKLTRIAKNELGDSVFATPAICGGRIYMRVAHREEDVRQEYLYCIGN